MQPLTIVISFDVGKQVMPGIAAVGGTPITAALDAVHLPAIALDGLGFVAAVNASTESVFDNEINIKEHAAFCSGP